MSYNVFSGVGVWAATSASLTVGSTVKFSSTTGVQTTVKLNVTSDATGVKLAATDTPSEGEGKKDFTEALTTGTNNTVWSQSNALQSAVTAGSETIKLTFTDDGAGQLNAGQTITYTFQIVNDNSSAKLYYKINTPTWNTTDFKDSAITVSSDNSTYAAFAAESGKQYAEIAASGSAYVKIVVTVKADTLALDSVNGFTALTFDFANANADAT